MWHDAYLITGETMHGSRVIDAKLAGIGEGIVVFRGVQTELSTGMSAQAEIKPIPGPRTESKISAVGVEQKPELTVERVAAHMEEFRRKTDIYAKGHGFPGMRIREG